MGDAINEAGEAFFEHPLDNTAALMQNSLGRLMYITKDPFNSAKKLAEAGKDYVLDVADRAENAFVNVYTVSDDEKMLALKEFVWS